MREDYNVTIAKSSEELKGKAAIMMKDLSDAVSLDEATQNGEVIIDVDVWAVLSVHNEKSQSKDYEVYVLIDKSGTKYKTCSEAFWSSATDIMADMADSDEAWALKVYRKPSKNFAGKDFLACSVV